MYDIYTEACNAPLFFFFANFFLTDAFNSTERLLMCDKEVIEV